MEKLRFCLFLPVSHSGHRTLRKRYVIDGGIFDLVDNILKERGRAYLFDEGVRAVCDGEETALPEIGPGAFIVIGEPEGEIFGESDTVPDGDILKVTSVTRRALGSPRMYHTVLTLK